MNINDFSDLTDFINNETEKSSENGGVVIQSKKILKFVDKQMMRYIKIYSNVLYKREKRKIILDEAIDTMPHGLLWKLLHWNLWKKIKKIENDKLIQKKKDELEHFSKYHPEPPISTYPVVVKKVETPEVCDEDDELEE